MTDANQIIDTEVKSNDVVLFMKGTPQFPMCGFSGQVVQMLNYLGVPYKGVNVLENETIRQGIKEYSNWPTIPQLYVKGEFIGGCDITREMFQAGELQQLAVQRGDQVERAAFLFELEREEERAARAEAEETLRESRARVDKATMDFTRAKSLRDKRVIAPEAYDTAQ